MNTLVPKTLRAAICVCAFTLLANLQAQHGLFREVYTDLTSAGSIGALTNDVNFPDNPSFTGIIDEFEAPDSFGDFYGQRVRGFIEAPQTGNYIFWIASDDQGQLFLSTDQQPQNKALIAEVQTFTSPRQWDKEATQRSAPIRLEEGRRYYIEALMDEGSGGDHLAVRWQLPDGTIEEPIPNGRLYVELIPPQIARQPSNVNVQEGAPATFSVQLVNKGPVSYQWLRNGVVIAGATNATYSIPATTLADSGNRFQVQLLNQFATNPVVSTAAFLTVTRDVTPPTITGAQTSGEKDLVAVSFSEALDPNSAQDINNYSILGLQVLGASLDSSGRNVILKTAPLTAGQTYTVEVTGVKDRASGGNEIEPGSTADFTFGFAPLSPEVLFGKAESPGPSTRRTGLVISEIMYHPAPRGDGRNLEFIEIFNSEDVIANIGGYRIAGSVDFTFPPGTFISPRGYIVVAAKPLDMQAIYGLPRVYGAYTNNLPASGSVRLLNDQGAVLLDLAYDSGGDWPSAADGAGPSLVLSRASYGEADPRAWSASDTSGGSPGRAETSGANRFKGLVINEFLAHTDPPLVDFVELYNYSSTPIDLSGVYLTDDISTNKYRIPAGKVIAPFGFVTIDEIDLGFALSSGGERIIVRDPQEIRVIESLKFGPQANGISMGRFPDGNPKIRQLASPTKNAPNSRPMLPQVVISEIMYDPISGNGDEEYVEIYNRGVSPVNLKGWRLGEGISYTFVQDTTIAPGAYLAIAKNIDLLRTNHPGTLSAANSIGNFSGNLSNGGERVSLERPEISVTTNGTQFVTNVFYVVVNDVKYSTGGRWPRWAAGGGSSMELIDLNSDNSEPSNWADSDETKKSSWVTIERRGIADNGPTNFPAANPSKNLHILLMGAGEALFDNAEVIRDGSTNLVSNPGLEKGFTDWLAGGTHDESTLETGSGRNGGNALHIRASARGDTSANRVRVRLTTAVTNGNIVTVRGDFRWLRGDPEVLLRLHGNLLEAPGVLPVPKNLGTPGAPNSIRVLNTGPVISAVQHTPVLPTPGQNATVIAQVDDPDRVALVTLRYRVDPKTNYTSVPMTYSGAGFYSGVIPGQSNLVDVAFYVEAIDATGALRRFPDDAPAREGVIVFGDSLPDGNLGTYHLWLTQRNIDRWRRREKSSNEALDATFVYNNERIVYNMGTLYSGSPFHWQGYDSPLGNGANYLMTFPDDDLFLGQNDFVLNLPSNIASDDTAVREQTFFWMADQLNQPYNYRRYHYLFINGFDRNFGSIFEDAQQPNGDFIKEWFPNDTGGDLYKIEDWFEYNDSFGFRNQDAELIAVWTTNVTTGLPELKQERYRWWFRKRAVRDSSHDYTELLRLVKAVNNPNHDQFVAETSALIDIDEWMGAIALRHAAGDWDSFGYSRGKNMYAYKAPGGKWKLMHWDIAFAFGLGDGTTQDLFDVQHFGGSVNPIDTITKRMMDEPVFRRSYLRALYEAATGPFIPSRVNPILDGKYTALVNNGVEVNAPDAVKSWIASRRDFILSQVAGVSSGFALTSNNGNNYSTNRNTVLLTGIAPVSVKTIRINGVEYPVTWTSVTGWEVRLALKPQANFLRVEGYDTSGNVVPGASASMTINVTTGGESLPGRVVINEIQYNPAAPGTEFIELYSTARTTSYDLSGYRLNGADFVFPPGTVIGTNGYLVVVKDRIAFGELYGFGIPIAGEFAGTLQNGGEALSLLGPGTDNTVFSAVRYDDEAPWPAAARGTGGSLQLIDPAQDASRVANWGARPGVATPGAANSVRATLPTFATLWVNEVQPNNLNGAKDAAGQADPWVELYNSGKSPVSLNGLYLTDDVTNNLTKWAFPAGASIASGQRVIVWLDGQSAQSTASEWHSSFRIDPSSGVIALTGLQLNAPVVFDYLAYDQLPGGQSLGAFPEGQAVYRAAFYKPTPGTANDSSSPAVQVVINEWMASNTHTIQDPSDLSFDDWFELYNAGSAPADLSGYFLTADLTDPNKFQIPSATIIPAHGYLLVWADSDSATNGSLHVDFKLSANGESIGLFAPDGSKVDGVTFGPQQADVSEGRTVDGGSQIGALSIPTPGGPNTGVDPNALQFTGVTISGANLTLAWKSESGAVYRIEYKDSLTDAAWSLLRTVSASGSSASTTDVLTGAHRFYRISKQ